MPWIPWLQRITYIYMGVSMSSVRIDSMILTKRIHELCISLKLGEQQE